MSAHGVSWAVRWTRDERHVFVGTRDGGSRDTTVRVWDLERGTCLRVLECHPLGVVSVAWSSDERRAYSCDWKAGIKVWDLA